MAAINEMLHKIEQGIATQKDLQEYAILLGHDSGLKVAKAILENNVADEDLLQYATQLLRGDYEKISDFADTVQNASYMAEGIHLKSVRPGFSVEDVKEALDNIGEKENVEESYIASQIEYVAQKVADRHMQKNAEAANKAGLQALVSRQYISGSYGEHTTSKHPKRCTFCAPKDTNGKMLPYPQAYADGIFQRHPNCRCIIFYKSAKGKETFQTEKGTWYDANDESALQYRQAYGFGENKKTPQERINELPKRKNVSSIYIKKATPGAGRIIKEPGYNDKNHKEENDFAIWLHETLGGEIVQNADSKTQGKHFADYYWNDYLWELKTISSDKYNTFDQHIRDANKQISTKRGGVFIDISGSKLSIQEAAEMVERSMKNRHIQQTDVLFKQKDYYEVIRIG